MKDKQQELKERLEKLHRGMDRPRGLAGSLTGWEKTIGSPREISMDRVFGPKFRDRPRGAFWRAIAGYVSDKSNWRGNRFLMSNRFGWVSGGAIVEDIGQMMKEGNEQLIKSKMEMEELVNQLKALADVTAPLIASHIEQIRAMRMTVNMEFSQMLKLLEDVRKFFMGSTHEVEMKRLEQFVKVAQDLRELKRDGTFDAVCDSIIRISMVDEFTFRLNEGNVARHTLARLDSFVDAVAGKRLTYKELTA